jgi:Lon protease-like protein
VTAQLTELPLFPLNTVLFPGGRLPLRIFEQRYMDMAKACLRDQSPFGVCLIREGREVGAPAIPADVGTLARIGTWDMPQLGVLHITALGEQRFRILERRVEPNGLARASIQMMDEEIDIAIPANCSGCVKLLEQVIQQQSALFEPPHRLDSAAWVSARLTELLPLPLPAKQELLELDNARTRIERLNELLRPPVGL